jgi:hypothetical protein
VGQPHVRSRGRAHELIRAHAPDARGNTDPGSSQSLQSHVPRYGQRGRAANDRDRDSPHDHDVARLCGHSLAYGRANLHR